MYTTCVIWLAFVPLYFGTANHVPLRITSMSVTISLSASVTVACLFSPKVSVTHQDYAGKCQWTVGDYNSCKLGVINYFRVDTGFD